MHQTIYFISMGDYMDNKIHARAISRTPRKTVPYISFDFVITNRQKTLDHCINNIDASMFDVALVGYFFDDEKLLIKQYFNVISEAPY